MLTADVNMFDGDNLLHPIFYLYQHWITSGKTDVRFTVICICSLKQIFIFCRHNTDGIVCTSICFSKSNVFFVIIFLFFDN
jgi:hypothetical protein